MQFLWILIFASFSLDAATLKESFLAARKNMESIKRAELNILQKEERKNLAKSALLPNLNAFGTYTKIDPPNVNGGISVLTLKRQYNYGIRLTQPLIRGGVMGAFDFAKDDYLLSEFQKSATELNLYQLVINNFYNLKIAQDDVKNLKRFLDYSKSRVKDIRARTNIGRSRRGELVEAEAQLHVAESQYKESMIGLKQLEEQYFFYTQTRPGMIADFSGIPQLNETLPSLLSKIQKRPDILATQQQVKTAEHQVTISKGGHYPTVDLVGNYYLDRTGALESSDWDAGIQVNIPIYLGGRVDATTREAAAGKRIAELTSKEAARNAEQEITVLFQNFKQLESQLKSQKQALSKSEEAYELNQKDYQNGLVTNLDVLQSLNTFIQNKRAYDSLYSLTHMTHKNLEAAVGVLP